MKALRKCKKCGSWAYPLLTVSVSKSLEVAPYDSFIASNKLGLNKKLHIPELDVLPSTALPDRRVIPTLDIHPCYLCRDGAATPGAMGCPYEASCAAIAYYYILAAKGVAEDNILRDYTKAESGEAK